MAKCRCHSAKWQQRDLTWSFSTSSFDTFCRQHCLLSLARAPHSPQNHLLIHIFLPIPDFPKTSGPSLAENKINPTKCPHNSRCWFQGVILILSNSLSASLKVQQKFQSPVLSKQSTNKRPRRQQYTDVQELESRLKNAPYYAAQFDVQSPELLTARTNGFCSAVMVQPKG